MRFLTVFFICAFLNTVHVPLVSPSGVVVAGPCNIPQEIYEKSQRDTKRKKEQLRKTLYVIGGLLLVGAAVAFGVYLYRRVPSEPEQEIIEVDVQAEENLGLGDPLVPITIDVEPIDLTEEYHAIMNEPPVEDYYDSSVEVELEELPLPEPLPDYRAMLRVHRENMNRERLAREARREARSRFIRRAVPAIGMAVLTVITGGATVTTS